MFQHLLKIITIEPIIALIKFGHGEIEGGQIQSDLLLWKICRMEFNYTEDICGNLTLDEYDAINNEVQAKANKFLIPKEWLFSGPALIWCLFAGTGSKIQTLVPYSRYYSKTPLYLFLRLFGASSRHRPRFFLASFDLLVCLLFKRVFYWIASYNSEKSVYRRN